MQNNRFYEERTDRNRGIIGDDGQDLLRSVYAAVVGNGGMGALVAEYLARIGVGRLALADNGTFDSTNLNRQLSCTIGNIGRNKAECTYERIKQVLDDDVEQDVYPAGITATNGREIFSGVTFGFDLCEAFEVPARIWTHKAAREEKVPLINCNVVGFGSRIFYFEPDGMTMEEMLDMDENEPMPLSDQSKLRLLQRLVPRWPESISQRIVEDWILAQGKAPIFGGTPLLSAGIAIDQITLRLLGAARMPWIELVPPMPAYGWFDVDHGMRGGIHVGRWW